MELPPQAVYELRGWFPPVIGWTDEYLHPILGHGGFLESKPVLKAFVRARKWGVPVSLPCYLEYAQCEICGILTRGGRKNHINEDWCCFAPSCFTKKQQASIASYPLLCRNPPELFQFELALQMGSSLFPVSRPQLQRAPPTIVTTEEVDDQITATERFSPVGDPGHRQARVHRGRRVRRGKQAEQFALVDVEDQITEVEQVATVEDLVPCVQGPVRVEPEPLSLRAELAIRGYSLWDLSPEVVARAWRIPTLQSRRNKLSS